MFPQQCWDHGCQTFDNAEVYSTGQSEIEMGQAFRDLGLKREEFVLTTSTASGSTQLNFEAKSCAPEVFFGTGRKDPNQKGLSRSQLAARNQH